MALSGWDNNKTFTFTIPSGSVASDKTNYPFRLDLSDSCGTGNTDVTAIFTELGANKFRIAAEINDSGEPTQVEVAAWDDTAQTATLWVLLPAFPASSPTTITLYYDSAADDQDRLNTAFNELIDIDDFTGSNGDDPNPTKWDVIDGSLWQINSNKLSYVYSGATLELATVELLKEFGDSGTIQMDLDFSNSTLDTDSWFLRFMLYQDDYYYSALTIRRSGELEVNASYRNGGSTISQGDQSIAWGTSGTTSIRIIRNDTLNKMYLQYWDGSSWAAVHNVDISSNLQNDDLRLRVQAYTAGGYPSVEFTIDNLQVVNCFDLSGYVGDSDATLPGAAVWGDTAYSKVTQPAIDYSVALPQFTDVAGVLPALEANIHAEPDRIISIDGTIPTMAGFAYGRDSNQYKIIDATLPAMTAEVTSPGGGRIGFIDAELPAFTGVVVGGGLIDGELPALSGMVVGRSSQKANIVATLPKITGSASTGAAVTAKLPSFTGIATAVIHTRCAVAGNIPGLTASVSAGSTQASRVAGQLPRLSGKAVGSVSPVAHAKATLPSLQARVTGKTGNIASVSAVLPKLTAKSAGRPENNISIVATLPVPSGTIRSNLPGAVSPGTLRHIRNLVR